MYTEEFWAILAVLIVFHFLFMAAIFVDWVGIIVRIFPVQKVPSGYEKERELRKSREFKEHRQLWIRYFLFSALIFTALHFAVCWVFQNSAAAYFVSIAAIIIIWFVMGGLEERARMSISNRYKNK